MTHQISDNSSLEQTLQDQFDFLQKDADDDTCLEKFNKRKLAELIKFVSMKGKLVGKTISDFDVQILNCHNLEQFQFQTVKEKKSNKLMLWKSQTIPYDKKLTFFKEIAFLASNNHKNIHTFQEIFFEFQEKQFVVNFLFSNNKISNFFSWIQKFSGETSIEESDQISMTKNQRSLSELRDFLIGLTNGLKFLQENKILHLDLSFGRLFVDEITNECLITGLGQDFDLHHFCSRDNEQKQMYAPEVTSYQTERLLDTLLELEDLMVIDKNDIFTPKVDIYALGTIFLKIFVHDEQGGPFPMENLDEDIIEKRIKSIFKIENEVICKNTLRDLKNIIFATLSEKEHERCDATQLLQKNSFFNRKEINLTESYDSIFIQALKFDQGDGVPRDYQKAFIILENLTHKKHGPSAYFFGLYLINGICKKDERLGQELCKKYSKAARAFFESKFSKTDKYYQFFHGVFYDLGHAGFKKDASKAIDFYRLAATNNHSSAFCNLAVKFVSKTNKKESFENYEQQAFQNCLMSAQMNDVSGLFNLGCLHARGCNGFDKEKDFSLAYKCYEKAGALGSVTALFQLAIMMRSGLGVPQDVDKAMQYLETAAEKGETVAQVRLAQMLESGDEVLQNFPKAFKFYKMAADRGNAESCLLISEFFSNGIQNLDLNSDQNDAEMTNMKKNFEKRIHYLKLGAKKKKEHILRKLGESFEHGELGSGNSSFKYEKDFALALNFYRTGSLVDPNSMFNFNSMIEDNKWEETEEKQFFTEFKDDTFSFW